MHTGGGEASGPILVLLLAWWEDETPAWKTVKDKSKTQAVTTRVGLEGTSEREKMRKKDHLHHLAMLCLLSIDAGEASEWGRGWQQ